MHANLAFNGMRRSPSVDAAVQRWVARLERVHPIAHCSMSIRVDRNLLGFGERVQIDLVVAAAAAEVVVTQRARLREPTDLYFLISHAFRDAHRRLQQAA